MNKAAFNEVYQALLEVSTANTFFDAEKQIQERAKAALATADAIAMVEALMEIAFMDGFFNGEKRLLQIARKGIRQTLMRATTSTLSGAVDNG